MQYKPGNEAEFIADIYDLIDTPMPAGRSS
jgi:hypothetical protein